MAQTTQTAEASKAGQNGAPSNNGQAAKAAPSPASPKSQASSINVHGTERKVSLVAGSALALWGVRSALGKGSWTGWLLAALGGTIVARGVTGHCPAYSALGVDTSEDAPPPAPGAPPAPPAAAPPAAAPPAAAPPAAAPPAAAAPAAKEAIKDAVKTAADSAKGAVETVKDTAKDAASSAKDVAKGAVDTAKDAVKSVASVPDLAGAVHVQKSVTIQKPAQELFDFWRNFENLPQFMKHLEEVRVHDDQRSMWIATGPAGAHIEWEAEITDEKPGKLIAWKSLPEADVPNTGSVQFKELKGDKGTEVKVTMDYSPTGGVLGAIFAQLWGEEPSQQVEEDLQSFKTLMESGEAHTAEA
jgi:uncharacterized membrane protein